MSIHRRDAENAEENEVFSSPRPLRLCGELSSLLRKYGKIFRISLIERLTYRGDFFLSTILRFLPMVTTILLWQAIYAGASDAVLSGFNLREMVAYLLLVHISRMFSSMPGLAGGICRDIRQGTLRKYLLQPIEMIPYLLSYRAAHKAAYIATSSLPYALLFFLCQIEGHYFDGVLEKLTVLTVLAYLASLILGFLLGFFFEAALGMVGFWFLEVTSLLYVVNTLNFFISGHMFPLDILPPGWVTLLKALPFQYLAYFPAAVFLGKIEGAELGQWLLIEIAWVIVFAAAARVLYRVGLRRYSAYGG
jgi:viologen exporter family transport system permease protein